MALREIALKSLEKTVKVLLEDDEQARQALQKTQGRCVAIVLKGTGLTLYCLPDAQGYLQFVNQWELEPDCVITGSPFDLIRARDPASTNQLLFGGYLKIEGDTNLGHQLSNVLANLHIDWEEEFSKLVGDTPAYLVGQGLRRLKKYHEQRQRTWQQNLAEYVVEEVHLLPHHEEMAAWSNGVAKTRDDVERLIARVALLKPVSHV